MTPSEAHVERFGVEPVVIGLHWIDVQQRIIEAIERGEPYNEEAELSPDELEQYKAGELVF